MTSHNSVEARLDALEREVRGLKDEREIRELLSYYGYVSDIHGTPENLDLWLDMWTDDGTLDVSNGASFGIYNKPQAWSGKEELRAFISNPDGHLHPDWDAKILHLQGNNVKIQIDGDEAVAWGYSIVLRAVDGVSELQGAGASRWEFRREDGQWRIVRRVRRELGNAEFTSTLMS